MKQDDNSVYEERLAQIEQMQEPMKTMALDQLSKDYPGLAAGLGSDVAFGEEMAMADSPKGAVAGQGNPYAVYVGAGPLAHAASGMGKFMGQKNRRKARGEMDALSAEKQATRAALLRAGANGGGGGMPGPGMMDEDEWERRYGRGRSA